MLSLIISLGAFLAFAFLIMLAQLKPIKRRRDKELDLRNVTNVIKLHNSMAPMSRSATIQKNVGDSAEG